MKIFLVGGTGLTGSYLLPRLLERGHTVYALTRAENKLEGIERLGATGMHGNIRDPEGLMKRMPADPDIIVLLAMPNVRPGQRMTRRRKAALREETNDFFRNSMDLALYYDIPLILPGGTSYRTEGNEVADETWPVLRSGLTEIGKDTDEMVREAIRNGRPGIVQLIYGKIYGNGGLFRYMYDLMAKGKARIPGKGDNFIPNIHSDDAASAIIKAIDKLPLGERFIIADDTPVTLGDFNRYMAGLMGKKEPARIPGFLIRIILGRDFYEIIRMNCKVSNAKAKKILDWHPRYPSYREGLEAVISEINMQIKN